MEAFVARQAIFDRERRVYGYELLFRSSNRNEFDGTDATSSTTQVLSTSLMSIGLNQLVGQKKAFVNFGREMLLSGFPALLPKDRAVIEILETVPPDAEVLSVCEELSRQGYLLALDDFVVSGEREAMLEHARIVKVEISTLTTEQHKQLIARYRKLGLKMLAEKVETPEQYSELRNLGYDYFQGYFFAKPVVIQSRQIPVMKLNGMRLLREITRPELDINRLADMISADVALSYGMLRYVNTAQFAVSQRVASVRQAMLYPSEAQLRKWVAMAVLPRASADKASELLTSSLVRAQMCELLARMINFRKPERAFLMGLFSFLDALLDQPLDVALAGVGLAGPILAALLGTATAGDSLTAIYDLVRSYEAGDWEVLAGQVLQMGVNDEQIRNAYCDAVTWAEKSMRDMEAHAKQCS